MKIGRLVNEKVLITFVCSMFSLLTLSTILSHIDIEENNKSVKASVSELDKTTKNEKKVLKVDSVDTYSKNDTLTLAPVVTEEESQPVQEEPVISQEQSSVETNTVATTNNNSLAVQNIITVQGTVSDYQAYAYSQFGNFGWSESDFQSLVQLWNRESGWNPNAHSGSGAHGIPQALPASKMSAYGDDYLTNYVTQINWGLNYINSKYGNPTNAWNHMSSTGWY